VEISVIRTSFHVLIFRAPSIAPDVNQHQFQIFFSGFFFQIFLFIFLLLILFDLKRKSETTFTLCAELFACHQKPQQHAAPMITVASVHQPWHQNDLFWSLNEV
jgi:hypothetical protein